MTAPDDPSAVANQKRLCAAVTAATRMMLGRFHPRPAWLVGGSLAVTAFLFAAERYQWFSFNQHKGWTVLIAVVGAGVALLLMLSWFILAVIFRGRFQFSLRALLALVVAVALPFSWLGVEMKGATHERQMAEALGKSGCYPGVWYAYGLEPGLSTDCADIYHIATGRVNVRAAPSEPQWLRDWFGEDFFCSMLAFEIEGNRAKALTVDDFRRVVALPFLKRLMLDDAEQLTDAEFAELKRKRGLERLFLRGTRITDQGLGELSSLTNLRVLSLAYTKITDKGLASLQGMTRLEILELIGTDISDEGLKHLRGLTSLQDLYLYCDGKKVTERGLQELRAALPNCNCQVLEGDIRRPDIFWPL